MARRNSRGDSTARKTLVRASAVENWNTALRGPSAVRERWLILLTFFFFFFTILMSTERGAGAVENLGSLRYWDRQYSSTWYDSRGCGWKRQLEEILGESFTEILIFVVCDEIAKSVEFVGMCFIGSIYEGKATQPESWRREEKRTKPLRRTPYKNMSAQFLVSRNFSQRPKIQSLLAFFSSSIGYGILDFYTHYSRQVFQKDSIVDWESPVHNFFRSWNPYDSIYEDMMASIIFFINVLYLKTRRWHQQHFLS